MYCWHYIDGVVYYWRCCFLLFALRGWRCVLLTALFCTVCVTLMASCIIDGIFLYCLCYVDGVVYYWRRCFVLFVSHWWCLELRCITLIALCTVGITLMTPCIILMVLLCTVGITLMTPCIILMVLLCTVGITLMASCIIDGIVLYCSWMASCIIEGVVMSCWHHIDGVVYYWRHCFVLFVDGVVYYWRRCFVLLYFHCIILIALLSTVGMTFIASCIIDGVVLYRSWMAQCIILIAVFCTFRQLRPRFGRNR